MKRIFVGIPIAKELSFNFAQGLRQEKGIRWIQPKNLHVTLVPPWYEENIQAVSNKLKAVRFKSFNIEFNQITFGPNSHQPRLIWASGKTSQRILDLRLKIYDILGQRPENRPFQLHTTLARFKAEDFGKFPVKKLNEEVDWKMKVESFALYESHLSSQGADYEILAEINLT